jgi:hypothetical protein
MLSDADVLPGQQETVLEVVKEVGAAAVNSSSRRKNPVASRRQTSGTLSEQLFLLR